MNLAVAISITAQAFEDKVDKGGHPYILHCLRVMNAVRHLGENIMCAAVMHDIIEDTNITLSDIISYRFNQRVCYLLTLLTHSNEHTYDEYIKQLSIDKDASAIKMADLRDNSDITRIKGLRKKDFDRLEKYHKSYIYLSN